MPNDMPRTPFVSKSIQRFVDEAFALDISERVQVQQATFLSPENVLEFKHGARWQSPANEVGDKSGQVETHSFEHSLELEDVVDGNPSTIFSQSNAVARGMMLSFERMLFAKLEESTEKSGNVVNSSDHASPLDAIAELLEKMDFSVNQDGELNMPTMCFHPDQHKKLFETMEQAPPEFKERIEELKKRKRKRALEREAERLARFERRES